ncbi:hypothetical protein JVT61DRAFT_6053 [Boletus reticuloceps]|uniref:Uncharacterized protein n=1 Tax=Boletus reticuloceps TaxID=495285 RepID=A0A8I2YKN5_9AGAM|nr:hypothetical protein JVT61DRAFT_6053 [Boletus reticuloceps]
MTMFSTTVILRRLSATHPTRQSSRFLSRTIHGSSIARQRHDPPNPVSHSVENYFVDSDDTPPPNASIYKVDASSDAAESAYEPPSGPWSRAGAETEEYRTVSKDEPYDVPGGRDVNTKYGGTKRDTEDKGPETRKNRGGPEGTERWGRKPEGRA